MTVQQEYVLFVFYFLKVIREYKDTYHLNFMFLKAIIYLTKR